MASSENTSLVDSSIEDYLSLNEPPPPAPARRTTGHRRYVSTPGTLPTVGEEETTNRPRGHRRHASTDSWFGLLGETVVDAVAATNETLQEVAGTVGEAVTDAVTATNETISEVAGTVGDVVETVTETVAEAVTTTGLTTVVEAETIAAEDLDLVATINDEILHVVDTEEMQEQLDETNEIDNMLEMHLTRAFSLLPTVDDNLQPVHPFHPDTSSRQSAASRQSIKHHDQEAAGGEHEPLLPVDELQSSTPLAAPTIPAQEHSDEPKEHASTTPCSAYITLLLACVSLSAIGPLLNLQQGVDATLKILWRTETTMLVLLPIALRQALTEICAPTDAAEDSSHKKCTIGGLLLLTRRQWIVLILAGCSNGFMNVLYSWALLYTAIGNATLLSNSQSMILLVAKVLAGHAILPNEGIGAVVAFGGAVLCSIDASSSAAATSGSSGGGGHLTWLGDLCGIGSALSGVFYVVFAKTLRQELDLDIFMCTVMGLSALSTWILLLLTQSPITYDRHVDTGVWGWMNPQRHDRLPLELTMVLVCNIMGTMGYVRCMHQFSSLAILVAGLMEPVVATLLAMALGIEPNPSWIGWLGNVLVISGTVYVVGKPSQQPGNGAAH